MTDFIFELKMDGFRALAHVGPDKTRLVSRKGIVYTSFPVLCASGVAETRQQNNLTQEAAKPLPVWCR